MIKESSYFNAQVKSLAFVADDGQSSVGVMEVGQYTFNTQVPERLVVIKGALTVKLPGQQRWVTYEPGETFRVAGNASFELQVNTPTAYLREYA